jgi:adenosylcobinamide-GDP ribazoletransferase
MSGLRSAVGFLTPVPAGAVVPDGRSLTWFPAVGALVGFVVGGAWWAAGEGFPVLVAAGLVVLVDVVATGALHLDGLADSADGLLCHADGPTRRREIMGTPDVGAFGVAAVAAALLLRWAAFASIDPDVVLVVALWAGSRSAMAVALVTMPYVGAGLGAAFLGARPPPVLVASVVLTVGLALVSESPGIGLVAVAGGALAAAAVVDLGRRRLGGVTGDVLGAAGVVAETVGLLLATARW